MPHAIVAASLQNVEKASHVTLKIGVRIGYRIAHTSLRSQIHNLVEAVFLEYPVGHLLVVNRHPDEKRVVVHRIPYHAAALYGFRL